MPTFDDVRRLGGRLPEVEEAPSYRGIPALKVRGRPFCRLWSQAEHELLEDSYRTRAPKRLISRLADPGSD